MTLVLRTAYNKAKNSIISAGNNKSFLSYNLQNVSRRNFYEDCNKPEVISSTILIENGYQVQELPVVVRILKNVTGIDEKQAEIEPPKRPIQESQNYLLIQTEFEQCVDLKDVFSLLTKCSKITPNIALGAMERIYSLENEPNSMGFETKDLHINLAKGAIMDKLLKVVMKTEETQTILNVLKSVSTFMDPYKHDFSDELLLRVIDNKLTIEQLCQFSTFLSANSDDSKYSETIEKLWVGFLEKESEINEANIVEVFKLLPNLKTTKRIILTLLEQKFSDLWYKITIQSMQDILDVFLAEKYLSFQSFGIVGRWLHTNIHAFDEDSLLDIITKLTRLRYTDDQVEKAVEKYMIQKLSKIESYVLVIGILNYCMQFHIRNNHILNSCSKYFVTKCNNVPHSFLKNFISPFGYLNFDPKNSSQFWELVEEMVNDNFPKMKTDDICTILLSGIYLQKYPLQLANKLFSSEYLVKANGPGVLKKLHLIDTALTLECPEYTGPMLPRDHCSTPITQDGRVKNIVSKLKENFESLASGSERMSTGVLIPNVQSHETYLIDVMIHPAGLGANTFNWRSKVGENENVAILIHLPDHYCSDTEQLIGPQVMKKRHLMILGLKVVSLKYSVLSQFYTTHNTVGLNKYIMDSVNAVKL